ncbi:MAG: hypothetical protein JWP82_2144 [Humibacillus sp.]|nr:hypothetical protein [Humibacillus sp.]
MSPIAVADLLASRPEQLSAAARRLEDHRRSLLGAAGVVLRARTVALGGQVVGPALSRWSGPAATGAAARLSDLAAEITSLAGAVSVAGQALSHAGLRLRAGRAAFDRASDLATRRGARLTDAGVLIAAGRPTSGDPVLDAHEAREDAVMREEVAAYVLTAQRVATESDAELARLLVATSPGAHPGARLAAAETGVLPTLAPPVSVGGSVDGSVGGADVFAAAAWWSSLTSQERGTVVRTRPEWVGPRDGLPVADRDAANRVLLDRAEEAATARVAALEAGGPVLPGERGVAGAPVLGVGLGEQAGALELNRTRLDALRAVRRVLERTEGGRRRLVLVDVSGRHPLAAVSIGEVDTAPHVTTFVGGFTTRVVADLEQHDAALARLRTESLGLARGDVAVVTWLGYDAPQIEEVPSPTRSVLSAGVAQRGGERLAAFVTGLDASRPVPADQSVLAHSYGSVVLSFALRRPTGIDRVALFGSPGTGGAVRSIVDTGLKAGGFSVLGSVDDPVVAGGSLVLAPRAASVLGATRLSTYAAGGAGSAGERRTSRGHSDYLKPGTDSARNLAAVAADRLDATLPESAGERLRKASRRGSSR